MRITLIAMLFSCLLAPTFVLAEGLGTINAEKTKLLKRIQCSRESTIPAGDGMGSLWGCYSNNEQVKLWINGEPGTPAAIRNIKLAAVNYHGSKMDVVGRIWSRILAEEYGGDHAESLKSAFQQCPVDQATEFPGYEFHVRCTKGPKADEHTFLIRPK